MDAWAQSGWPGRPMMFSRADRSLMFELKAKLESLAGRLGVVETEQATQKALAKVHGDDAKEFRKEFDDFASQSRTWRDNLQSSIYSSNNALLWRVIGAMGALLTLAVTIGFTLLKNGVR